MKKRSLPIGVKLRNENQNKKIRNERTISSVIDIENQIKLLEDQLNHLQSESEEEEESEEITEDNSQNMTIKSLVEVIDDNGNVVSMKSHLDGMTNR